MTAWMLEPYEGSTDSGLAMQPADELEQRVRACLERGLATAVHAIGDRANRAALDIYERLRDVAPQLPRRIEHAQLLTPDDLPRFAALGIVASVQPIHATQDMAKVDRSWGGARPVRVRVRIAARERRDARVRLRRARRGHEPDRRHPRRRHAPQRARHAARRLVPGRAHLARSGARRLHERRRHRRRRIRVGRPHRAGLSRRLRRRCRTTCSSWTTRCGSSTRAPMLQSSAARWCTGARPTSQSREQRCPPSRRRTSTTAARRSSRA